MQDKKVNLFIVGAMKAGTTSFVEMLSAHNDVYVPPVKEPHYFVNNLPKNIYEPSRFFSLENYLQNEFPKPLHITKIETEAQYKKVYSLQNNQTYLVDASTCYLTAPESPELIKKYHPDAKIIILVRNPLQRAYSHYTMAVGLARETRSFNEAIKQEIVAFKNKTLPWHSYLKMSMYKNPIKRYQSLFDSVLLLTFEELYNQPQETLNKVATFLQIKPFTAIKTVHKNKSKTVRFKKVFFYLKKIGLKDIFSKVVPRTIRHKIFSMVSTDKKPEITLTQNIKKELESIFNQ